MYSQVKVLFRGVGLLDENRDLECEFKILNDAIRKSYADLDTKNREMIDSFRRDVKERLGTEFDEETFHRISHPYDFHKLYSELMIAHDAKDAELCLVRNHRRRAQREVLELIEQQKILVDSLKYAIVMCPDITFNEDTYKIINGNSEYSEVISPDEWSRFTTSDSAPIGF